MTLYHGIASVKGPKGRQVVVSEEKTAGSRRAVRARCSEQVLLRMYHEKDYLQNAIDGVKAASEEEDGGAVDEAPLEGGPDGAAGSVLDGEEPGSPV